MAPMQFVKGTSGLSEYLVVQKAGRCVVAIKPEMGHTQQHNMVALLLRVRFCGDPDQDLATPPLVALEIAQTFPKITLKNIDNSRASIVIGKPFKKENGMTLRETALDRSTDKEFVDSIVGSLEKNLGEMLHSNSVLANWISQRWERQSGKIAGKVEVDEEAIGLQVEALLDKLLKGGGKPTPEEA
jgi:hypothetical protein